MPQSAAKRTDHGLLCAAADVQVCDWLTAKALTGHGARIASCDTINGIGLLFFCFDSRFHRWPTEP